MTTLIDKLRAAARFLQKQLDKIPNSPGLLKSGMWRVLYNDGNWSKKMTYDVCKDYAEIFGGSVHWVRYNDPAICIAALRARK